MATITQETYPWLKSYPEGVPYEINPDAYPSLLELMEEGFRQHASEPAYSNMGKELTFGDIDRLSKAFAAYLQSIGLQPGDRVSIQMPNLLQYPVAMFGILRAGMVVVNTNPLYTPREMQHQFKDSGAKAIVILANFASNLEKIIGQYPDQARDSDRDWRYDGLPQTADCEPGGEICQENGTLVPASPGRAVQQSSVYSGRALAIQSPK